MGSRRQLGIGAAVALAAAIAASTAAPAAPPSCGLVPATVIRSALGVTVGALKVSSGHGQVYCSYTVGAVPDALHVIFVANKTLAAFNTDNSATGHAFPGTKPVAHLGDAAFTYSLGSGPYGTTNLSVHQGTKEVTITAASTLPKEEALAKRLLAEF